MLYRDSWIEIDLSALKYNIEYIRKSCKKEFMAVIKANGYGADDFTVATTALQAKAAMLAVSSLDEALSLRKNQIDAEILILGYVDPQFAPLLKENKITSTVVSLDWARNFVKYNCEGCKVHLKIDTGMHRLGLEELDEIKQAIAILNKHKVEVEGIFTHFACSDNEDNNQTNKQFIQFKDIVKALDVEFKWVHCSNSDATIHFEEDFSNIVRCGIAMFGVVSYETVLKPVMSLKSKVVSVKNIKKNDGVSYGYHYRASEDETIAVIPLGYADGFNRKHEGRTVYVKDTPCSIVGRICMDQSMIKVPMSTRVHDEVEIFGKHTSIKEVAKELDTIPYEIMTSLSDRLAKVILEDNQIVKVVNSRFR